MSCELYKETLIELAAASVGGPVGMNGDPSLHASVSSVDNAHDTVSHLESRDTCATHAHLQSCPACRATFMQQQALFAAIDSGLHKIANPDFPPSFLAKVRTATRTPRRKTEFARGWAVAAALAIFAVAVGVRWSRFNDRRQQTILADSRPIASYSPHSMSAGRAPQGAPGTGRRSARRQGNARITPPQFAEDPHSPAEVLVPSDERGALFQFVRKLPHSGEMQRALLQPAPSPYAPISVEPIQIAHLQIAPIDNEEDEYPWSDQELSSAGGQR